MNNEWRRNPSFRRATIGLAVLFATFGGMLFAIVAGVRTIPMWTALVLAIVLAIGVFLLAWGLGELQ